ncbi:MAG: hypothetical protein KGJ37_07775, partial [Verrucomicrobiota bacterium]|nr:hypothetical protein [Verrucomicrobiota bacterium]
VSRAARAGGVTVAVSGLGGDELFGGSPSFRDTPRIARWLPLWHRLPAAVRRCLRAGLSRGGVRARKLADFLYYAHNAQEVAALQRRVFSEAARCPLLHPDLRTVATGQPPFHPQLEALSAELADAGVFEMVSAWELRTYMSDVLLRDSDVMSMRHSLELRVPFIDRPLIEWLWHQPARFKENAVHPKSALIAAVSDLLPPEVLRRKKQGFTLPFAIWMRNELRPFLEETFSSASASRSGFFAASAVQSFWLNFLKSSDTRRWSRVWSLAVLIAFVNRLPVRPQHEHTSALS